MDRLDFIEIGKEYIDEILLLEPQIYQFGWSSNLIKSEFDKPFSRRYGLLLEDCLIGYSFNYIVEDEFHLLNIGIDPSHHAKGFGGKLLDYVISSSRALDCNVILLEVRKGNEKARSLYHSRGFQVNGIRTKYYSDNLEDAVLMSKDLTVGSAI
jgi:ribosomal-protein-alanine N-acetyltransferase